MRVLGTTLLKLSASRNSKVTVKELGGPAVTEPGVVIAKYRFSALACIAGTEIKSKLAKTVLVFKGLMDSV